MDFADERTESERSTQLLRKGNAPATRITSEELGDRNALLAHNDLCDGWGVFFDFGPHPTDGGVYVTTRPLDDLERLGYGRRIRDCWIVDRDEALALFGGDAERAIASGAFQTIPTRDGDQLLTDGHSLIVLDWAPLSNEQVGGL